MCLSVVVVVVVVLVVAMLGAYTVDSLPFDLHSKGLLQGEFTEPEKQPLAFTIAALQSRFNDLADVGAIL